jgi:hypothetical protein
VKKLNLVNPESGFVVGYIQGGYFFVTEFGRDLSLEIEGNEIKQWISRDGQVAQLETLATIEKDIVRTRSGAIFKLEEANS